jgi:hypothetical protein
MKTNYTKIIMSSLIFFLGLISYSQNIQITFENAQNTNDGNADYYEADIMIQTIDGQADFKLGSGQLYFNYNSAAFGENVVGSNSFVVSANYASGYFLGEKSGFTDFYDITTVNDNTPSKVSWAFSQGVSSGAMTAVVSTTPKKMVHIKLKYANGALSPEVAFEDDETVLIGARDQFFSACGPFDSASTTLDCSSAADAQNVPNQFFDAMLVSSGATLSNKDFELQTGISLYPNPAKNTIYINGQVAKLTTIDVYSLTGKHIMNIKNNLKEIDVSGLQSGIYFVKLNTKNLTTTKKVIIE